MAENYLQNFKKNLPTEFLLNLPIHYLTLMQRKSGATKLICKINWINRCKFSAILLCTVVIATNLTLLNLLTVLVARGPVVRIPDKLSTG